jgi:hypothetical protein
MNRKTYKTSKLDMSNNEEEQTVKIGRRTVRTASTSSAV